MDKHVQSKISHMVYEVNALAKEIEGVSNQLAQELKGIGETKCSQSLKNAADTYRNVANELRKI